MLQLVLLAGICLLLIHKPQAHSCAIRCRQIQNPCRCLSTLHMSMLESSPIPERLQGEDSMKSVIQIDENLAKVISEYLSLRDNQVQKLASNDVEKKKEDIKKANKAPASSPLGMVKPTGWFKDVREIELQARSDRRTPLIPHPLSYYELKQYGYERLSEQIIALGGPKLVGEAFGIDWKDLRFEKEVWDESLRPVRQETYALDMRGELSLGSSLDDKLSLAGEIDVEDIKERLAQQAAIEKTAVASLSRYRGQSNSNDAYDPFEVVDFNSRRKEGAVRPSLRSTTTSLPKVEHNGERFSLVGSERIFLVIVIALTSIAHGRASQDLVEFLTVRQGSSDSPSSATSIAVMVPQFLDVISYFSYGSYAASIVSAMRAGILATEKLRSPLLWGAIGFLGGPGTIRRLNDLKSL